MTFLLDKRLRVGMTILRETMQKGESEELKWLCSEKNWMKP